MPLQSLGKALILIGVIIVVIGLALWLGSRAGLGQLPGDISWKRGPIAVHFPIITCIILSVVVTIVLNLLARFFR